MLIRTYNNCLFLDNKDDFMNVDFFNNIYISDFNELEELLSNKIHRNEAKKNNHVSLIKRLTNK